MGIDAPPVVSPSGQTADRTGSVHGLNFDINDAGSVFSEESSKYIDDQEIGARWEEDCCVGFSRNSRPQPIGIVVTRNLGHHVVAISAQSEHRIEVTLYNGKTRVREGWHVDDHRKLRLATATCP